MTHFLAAFVKNTVFANMLLLLIFMGGAFAMFNMVRETFPETSLDIVNVTVAWPGADPEEVEEGISRKIEDAVGTVDGVKQVTTFSVENLGHALIEIRDAYDTNAVQERIRNAVEAIDTFPDDAERPITERFVVRLQVTYLTLSGENMTERELKEWAEEVKLEIEELAEVSRVNLIGARDYEISIEVSETRLREYGMTFDDVANAVRANSLNLPGGMVRTDREEIRLRTMGRRYTAEDFADLVVLARPNGDVITLDRIATIRDEFKEGQILSHLNGVPAVSLRILKTTEEDTLVIFDAVQEYVKEKQLSLPPGAAITIWGDAASILQDRIFLLLRNGAAGLVLVFITLWLFLDIRLSFWAGMGIPICIMGALVILWYLGATINMISLFGLITVLGIIIDDAIVVGEAIYVARKEGAPPLLAAVRGVQEVGIPVIAAVITTIVAFTPMFFTEGFMGKLIFVLPVVVISCLMISLVESLFLLPAHLSHLPDPKRPRQGSSAIIRFGIRFHEYTNGGLERFAANIYKPTVSLALKWRYAGLGIAFVMVMFTTGLLESGILKFHYFPEIDGDSVQADIELPNGTPVEVTEDAVEKLEAAIQRVAAKVETGSGDPLIRNVFSLIGAELPDVGDVIEGQHLGSVRVELLTSSLRNIHTEELMALWEEELGVIPGVLALSFKGEEAGLPGAPIEIWLKGNDLDRLLEAAGRLETKLDSYAGVYQIQNDFRQGKNEIRLHLKEEARALGITTADLARQVYAGYFGEEAVRIQRGRDDVRVRVRYPESERETVANFESIRIRSPYGFEVPLLSVADLDFGPGYAAITRLDGQRRIAVTAEVNTALGNTTEIMADMKEGFFDDFLEDFPGVSISLQGDEKNSRETFASLIFSGPLAILAIYIIIASTFRSYVQPMVIMLTVPMGIVGAVLGHLLLGYDLSMLSVFGMTALAGVVVNDAIVLIERVNHNLSEKMPFFEAVTSGGVRRFRPIFLTTISTVGGLTPLILETDFQARVMIPMAISIASGVAFATVLTLVFIPSILCILNDLRCLLYRGRHGQWPAQRELVEPAHWRNVELDSELDAHGHLAVPTESSSVGHE